VPPSHISATAARQAASNVDESLKDIQQRLADHEAERKALLPSRRRAELDVLIARDLADLCDWYRRRATRDGMRAA
jgi:hypothetical protein